MSCSGQVSEDVAEGGTIRTLRGHKVIVSQCFMSKAVVSQCFRSSGGLPMGRCRGGRPMGI